jgi:hypothetical protein
MSESGAFWIKFFVRTYTKTVILVFNLSSNFSNDCIFAAPMDETPLVMSATAELICLVSNISRRNISIIRYYTSYGFNLSPPIKFDQCSVCVSSAYLIKLLKQWLNLNDIQKFGSHFTANTLHLHYKDKKVNAVREIITLYRDNRTKTRQ